MEGCLSARDEGLKARLSARECACVDMGEIGFGTARTPLVVKRMVVRIERTLRVEVYIFAVFAVGFEG